MQCFPVRIDHPAVAVHKQGCIFPILFFRSFHGLPAPAEPISMPEIILIAQGNIGCAALLQQAPEISHRPQTCALLRTHGEPVVRCANLQKGHVGIILRAIILQKHTKRRVVLPPQAHQLLRQIPGTVIGSQQHIDLLHHSTPHFMKNWHTDRICRSTPFTLLVFSRAQLWVTHISG